MPRAPRLRPSLLACLPLWLCACSFTFDDSSPDVPLLGEPPLTAELPHLNRGPGEAARVVRGVDGAPWVALREQGSVLRLVRLQEPPAEELLQALQVQFYYRSVYLLDPSLDPGRPSLLRIRTPGARLPDQQLQLPPGEPLLLVGGGEDVFLYWVRSADTRHFDVVRRDGRRRSVPLPEGLDPENPLAQGMFFWSGPGDLLFVRDGIGRLRSYETAGLGERDYGWQPRALQVLDGLRAVLSCGEDGLQRLPMDDGDALLLDGRPCNGVGLRVVGRSAYYLVDGVLQRAALDGRTPPEVAFPEPARQILAAGQAGEVAYTSDSGQRFASGAVDGWIGRLRFMERGRLVSFRGRGGRVRWLEGAATITGAGDLMAQDLSGAPPLHLSRNVRAYLELPDGRILCASNYAFRGGQNRIIVIDEERRTARWVADGASVYLPIPGSTDVLVQLVREDRGFDLVRVPVPPPER